MRRRQRGTLSPRDSVAGERPKAGGFDEVVAAERPDPVSRLHLGYGSLRTSLYSVGLNQAISSIEGNVMDTINDCVQEVKEELSFWHEILSCDLYDDPLFEEMVSAFKEFDMMLSDLTHAINAFMMGVDSMRRGMDQMAHVMLSGVQGSKTQKQFHSSDDLKYVRSQVVRYKETTQAITHEDAPKSAYAKLNRDLNYNIAKPLKEFLQWSSSIKGQLCYRKRLLGEFQLSKKEIENLVKRRVDPADMRVASARDLLVHVTNKYGSIDRHCYVWLTILEDFRIDIWDTITQTLKHLQYEFFKSATETWRLCLPTSIEFRPFVEMTPRLIQDLVEDEENELRKKELNEIDTLTQGLQVSDITDMGLYPFVTEGTLPSDCVVSATKRRIISPQYELPSKPKATIRPDPLNLSLLVAQGIDKTEAEAALIKTENDFQAALDLVLLGEESCEEDDFDEVREKENEDDTVIRNATRKPTSMKWVAKHRELMKRRRIQNGDEAESKDDDPVGRDEGRACSYEDAEGDEVELAEAPQVVVASKMSDVVSNQKSTKGGGWTGILDDNTIHNSEEEEEEEEVEEEVVG